MAERVREETVLDKLPMSPGDFKKLLEMLKSVKYGSVTIIIQDGRVIQIDKNEKMRLK